MIFHPAGEDDDSSTVTCASDSSLSATVIDVSAPGGISSTAIKLMEVVDRNYPEFKSLCGTLSTQAISAAQGDHRSKRLYDELASGSGYVAVLLLPSLLLERDREANILGSFWDRALQSRYVRGPVVDAGTFTGLLTDVDNWDEKEPLNMQFPLSYLFPWGEPSPPVRAKQEFGQLVERLQSDWSTYLEGAAITFRRGKLPLMSGGSYNRLIPHFSAAEIGSPRFWAARDDLSAFLDQADCLKQHFLVDRGYVPPDESLVPGQCIVDEFRLQNR